jgi:DNA-binding HxlR family transcriptional regulator
MNIRTSTSLTARGWRIGRALQQAERFTDLLPIANHHTDVLARCLKKLIADGLVVKRNDGLYQLTAPGHLWIEAAMPLLRWVDEHPRNATPRPLRGNDPVLQPAAASA